MNDYGTVLESGTVRFERLLPGPIERVWEYLTDPGKRATWLAGGVTEPRVGGRVELRFRHADLSPRKEAVPDKYRQYENGVGFEGRVTRWEPPRALAYSWGGEDEDSEVLFELTPRGDRVLLVLTHSRLGGSGAMVNVSGGWHTHLGILDDVLAGRTPQPFWTRHAALEAEYERRIGPA